MMDESVSWGSPALFNASRGSNDDKLGASPGTAVSGNNLTRSGGSSTKVPWGSPFSPTNQSYVSPRYSPNTNPSSDSNRSLGYDNRSGNHYFQQRHHPSHRTISPISSTPYNCQNPLLHPRSTYPPYQHDQNCHIPRCPPTRNDRYSRHSTPYNSKLLMKKKKFK